MVETVRKVYESYGYVPLETPAVEFVDVLGKFLPESATPAGGIFAFRNPDVGPATGGGDSAEADRWLALRYDLTASLARVAAQYRELTKPFRRYQIGSVYRYEKPGPGRFREFTQFDFDSVGVASMAADAEACCIMCDAMEALGFSRGDYVVRVNDRKALQGVLEVAGVISNAESGQSQSSEGDPAGSMLGDRVQIVLRAIDKVDRLGERGVAELLGRGRKDDSGDFTAGAHLDPAQIDTVLGYLRSGGGSRASVVADLATLVGGSTVGAEGVAELRQIDELLTTLGYGDDRVLFDPTIVRGLAYYTGPVFECVITKEIVDPEGQSRQFGSVFGGGRYDTLVERFTGEKVPATGASVGVDRLLEAVKLLEPNHRLATADVLVVVVEKPRLGWYMSLAQQLRRAGVATEVYLGEGGMRAQVKYADRLGVRFAIIAGGNELDRGVVQVKDLVAGAAAASQGVSNEEWRKGAASQRDVPVDAVVEEIRRLVVGA
jgi:histidyl-tRNA synthetase